MLILMNTFYLTFQYPFYQGIFYLHGYLCSFITQKGKINDKDIRYYFHNERIKEILRYIITEGIMRKKAKARKKKVGDGYG